MKIYIIFEEVTTKKKTGTWIVRSNVNINIKLGIIEWYASWRKYTFKPFNDTIFDAGCLMEVMYFINKRMEERQEKEWDE
jgi:hypothetical protein